MEKPKQFDPQGQLNAQMGMAAQDYWNRAQGANQQIGMGMNLNMLASPSQATYASASTIGGNG